jgi:hypothetical protein
MNSSGAVSGTITYSAAEESGGSYGVAVVAVDSQGASATEYFTWTVTNTDRAPTLDNPGNQTNAEQDGAWIQLTASDPDGDPLTYSATGLPSGVTIDPTMGLISGMIDTTAAAGSPYTTTVTVSDGTLSTSQSFTWTVTNGPPSVTYPGYQTNAQGDTVSLPISATDPHGATLSYSATGLPPGLAIDPGSGVISGTISPTASAGSPYDTIVTVSNGTLPASTEFSWTVTPLSVISPGPQTNATSDSVSLPISVDDNDGDTLSFSASSLPPGLAINSSTGLISGTVSEAASGTPYNAVVTAYDGTDSNSQTFTWTVTHATNPPPVLTNPGNQSNNVNDKVGFQLTASDPNGNPLTFSATGLPPGLSIDGPTGIINGFPDDWAASGSPYQVTVTASNGFTSSSQTFNWSFSDPSLSGQPTTLSGTDGTSLYDVPVATFTNANVGNAEDFTNYAATIDWGDGSVLDTGVVTGANGSYTVLGTHTYADAGTYTVNVTLAEDSAATATVSTTATISNAALTASGVPVTEMQGSAALVPLATFTDSNPLNATTPYLAVINWGDGSTVDSIYVDALDGAGIVYGSHPYSAPGSYTVSVEIFNGGTLLATASSTATVGNVYYGLPFGAAIFSFLDSSPGSVPPDYSATIDWGDGSTSAGVVVGFGNLYEVESPPDGHVYAQPGQYTLSVTVTCDDGGSSATTSVTVTAVPRALTLLTAPVYATNGLPTLASSPIALVVDPNPGSSPSGTPSLSWGDGTTSSGTLTGSGGLFQLTGSHTYTVDVGTYAVSTTLNFAPTQVVPLIAITPLAANLALTVDPKTGTANCAGGVLGWAIEAPNALGSSVSAAVMYLPDKKNINPATVITFLQVCTSRTLDGKPFYSTDPVETAWFSKLSTDKNKANKLDSVPGRTAPYYGVTWQNGQWALINPNSNIAKLGSGKNPALAYDEPSTKSARSNKGVFIATYETVAFCVDTQQVLGAITWGYEVPNNQTAPVVILNATKADFSLNASADFKGLIKQANGGALDPNGINNVMTNAQIDGKPKITAPDTSKMNLKGTSALP